MAENLLRNPGFEGITRPGGYTHKTHTGEEYGNFVSPDAWIGWWDERQQRRRPETKVIPLKDPFIGPPRRIYEGNWAVMMFVSFHPWIGGYYQVVDELAPGGTYDAGFHVHAWANTDGLPHSNDPGCAPMGCGALYRLETDLPPLSGDPVQDAWWAALYQVGIQHLEPGQSPDPTYDVHWGPAAAVYNVYAAVPTLTFEAKTDRVAVFIRGSHKWQFRNNDAYYDSAWLHLAQGPQPSDPYERYSILLPPDVTENEAARVVRANFAQRRTISFSAGDVANREPNCTKVTVDVIRPQTWPGGKEGLVNYWETYYKIPDEIIWTGEPNPWLVAQCDERWADEGFGDSNCQDTICESGCFITACSMAQRYYGIDEAATPVTVDNALGPAGYVGCIANWAGQPNLYRDALNLKITRGVEVDATSWMAEGGCTFAEVLPTTREHFIFVYQADPEVFEYTGLDPWTNEERRFYPSEAQSWRVVEKVTSPHPPDTKSRLGLHLQQEVGDWRGMSAITVPMKFLAGIQNIVTCKQRNPEGFPVWRQWVQDQGVYLSRPNDAGANAYLDTFRDSMEEVLEAIHRLVPGLPWPWFGVESLNETYAHGDPTVITNSIPFDRAWIRVLEGYPEVAPVVYCAAVGNVEMPSDSLQVWSSLVDLGRAGMAQNAVWGYHNYWWANQQDSGLVSDWPWLAGRWTEFDKYLVSKGVHVNWFFGETGGVGGYPVPGGYHLEPHSGWKHPNCYAGNWPRYEADLLELNSRIQSWNSTHNNRSYGGTIFTTGGGSKWKTFEIGEAQINRLIQLLS